MCFRQWQTPAWLNPEICLSCFFFFFFLIHLYWLCTSSATCGKRNSFGVVTREWFWLFRFNAVEQQGCSASFCSFRSVLLLANKIGDNLYYKILHCSFKDPTKLLGCKHNFNPYYMTYNNSCKFIRLCGSNSSQRCGCEQCGRKSKMVQCLAWGQHTKFFQNRRKE